MLYSQAMALQIKPVAIVQLRLSSHGIDGLCDGF